MRKIEELLPDCNEFKEECKKFEQHEKRDAMYEVARFLIRYYLEKKKINFRGVTNGLGVLLLTWNQAFYRYGIFDFDELEKVTRDNMRDIKRFRRKKILELTDNDEKAIENLFTKFLGGLQISVIKFSGENKKGNTLQKLKKFLVKVDVSLNMKAKKSKTLYNSIKNNSKIKNSIEFIPSGASSKKDYIAVKVKVLEQLLNNEEKKFLESILIKSPVAVSKALHLLAPKFFPLWDRKIAKKYGYNYDKEPAEKYVSFCTDIKEFAVHIIKRNCEVKGNKSIVKKIDEYNYSKYSKEWKK